MGSRGGIVLESILEKWPGISILFTIIAYTFFFFSYVWDYGWQALRTSFYYTFILWLFVYFVGAFVIDRLQKSAENDF